MDRICAKKGIVVLRIPTKHCELNPIGKTKCNISFNYQIHIFEKVLKTFISTVKILCQ